MKYLKVDDNKAYFFKSVETGEPWHLIDEINKDDLFKLLNAAVELEFEMDDYTEDSLQNKAHYIIYKHLHSKFLDLIVNKNKFKDDSDNLYKEAYEKYKKSDNLSSDVDLTTGLNTLS